MRISASPARAAPLPKTHRRCRSLANRTPASFGHRKRHGSYLMEIPMNASLLTADRHTHVKLVVIALVAAIAVAGIAIRINVANTELGSVTPAGSELVFHQAS